MVVLCPRLWEYLDQQAIPYLPIRHPVDFTSQETAAHTHTRGKDFAKTVVIWVNGRAAAAVLPAHHRVELRLLRSVLGTTDIRLATEEEMAPLFPDCEVGAEPVLANLYDLPVYVSRALTDNETITFNAGTHSDAVRMKFSDFLKSSRATVLPFSVRR